MTAPAHLPRPSLTLWRDAPRQRQRRKYANQPTTLDGIEFHSKAEAARWRDLTLLERAGRVAQIRRQVRYVLVPKQQRPSGGVEREIAYVADFVYRDTTTGREVCEDVKGASTPEYRIKRKLMLWVHGIEVKEVKA